MKITRISALTEHDQPEGHLHDSDGQGPDDGSPERAVGVTLENGQKDAVEAGDPGSADEGPAEYLVKRSEHGPARYTRRSEKTDRDERFRWTSANLREKGRFEQRLEAARPWDDSHLDELTGPHVEHEFLVVA